MEVSMTTLLAQAQSAGLTLTIEANDQLLVEGPADAETLALDLLSRKAEVIAALTVLDLARGYDWGVAVIVGGAWRIDADGERELLLGEVVGGDESHWRAFADRASEAQLHEAAQILMATASTSEPEMSAADVQLEIPPGAQTFRSIPCKASPDGWAEFSQLRATPTGPLLCVHCGEVHKEARFGATSSYR
jgi:hypothetical protein